MISPVLCVICFLLSCLYCAATGLADERPPELTTDLAGVTLSLVAEHPSLATPTGIDVDSAGRIWVVATHTHFRPDDYVGPEHDEILIFEDRDGDGTAESRTVFSSSTDATMDLELGPDNRVYLAERDRILKMIDSDGDDKADVTEDLVVLDTEAVYPHNGLEGLAWHPDGRLVFGLGENFAKPWTLTGTDGRQLSGTGEGGVFSCAPDGSGLHRIAHGFWNPFGICVRADGTIFASDNDPGERPPCRLLHVVEGGDYGYQRAYGSEAHHPFVAWNGELPGTLPMVHPTGEAPCGVVPLRQGLIIPSWSDHHIDFFRLTPQGASYTAERLRLVQGGRYFRPGCIAEDRSADSESTWYLTDWVDGRYQSHGYGRLWKLSIEPTADWLGPIDLPPPTQNATRATELRAPGNQHSTAELLATSHSTDPFLARAALNALSRVSESWTPDLVRQWSPADRRQAVIALCIARAEPGPWIRTLLSDADTRVRFQTLKWIADAQLADWLPEIETMLNDPTADYQLFEALIAAWNTLHRNAESGLRNSDLLLRIVQDGNRNPALRAWALRLLPVQPRNAPKDGSQPSRSFPEGLTVELLQSLLDLKHDALSLEAVRTLAGSPTTALPVLRTLAADETQSSRLRAEATVAISAQTPQGRELLFRLAGSHDHAVRDEALRALRFLQPTPQERETLQQIADEYPRSSALVQAALDPASLKTGRPPLSETQAWLDRLQSLATPPDKAAGERLFHNYRLGQCANCHRHRGRGNVVGPDLSGQGQRGDSLSLLQSILEPSRQMAPEYQPRTMILTDGRAVTGIRLRSSTSEVLRDANGQNISFSRDNIESITESDVSFMPAGLTDLLTLRELRDLLAFLEQR